ncbi:MULTISPECIES: acyl-CoA dehydrogenase family protein [Pseudonocardia]|uniref:Acyl-CoA dehydrogenase/oxidase C-terminal domain-containing protein n=2 Tax=Pseudonocardia TaxID=1847 RepID=A0ABQ0RW26_9PSEU|nr:MULTISPECIES: acyl-CoA dehydrogenase family protein [Pseudonocardia]OSY40751.1 putative acyl-CoA dehydrogenase [Pseudonocardia autotrophica]TDN71942.1 acyl-CoA dehydrogenase-like protein [Pseudonocardia autotrophica]BBG02629.1 hypothetical protein Pdca_38380 [Pseudonocardia autotrophica]GEC24688.1 hypothetical protein PSA01_17170 [Pseudonocardia saturnea]
MTVPRSARLLLSRADLDFQLHDWLDVQALTVREAVSAVGEALGYLVGAENRGLPLYCGLLIDDERTAPDPGQRAHAALLLDVPTPIAKSRPSQWCPAANDLAIQIHGGYGYTREYDVEQHYRDNRLNPIHEGTHGLVRTAGEPGPGHTGLRSRRVLRHPGAEAAASAPGAAQGAA